MWKSTFERLSKSDNRPGLNYQDIIPLAQQGDQTAFQHLFDEHWNYLYNFHAQKEMSEDEIEDRAKFAYEACVIMRDRIQNYELGKKFFGYSEQEAREAILKSGVNDDFRGLLFNRVMPNLKKIGLLTESVRPLYDELGLLEYEVAPSDFEIDWAEISKPLESSDEIETQAEEQAEVIKEMFHNH